RVRDHRVAEHVLDLDVYRADLNLGRGDVPVYHQQHRPVPLQRFLPAHDESVPSGLDTGNHRARPSPLHGPFAHQLLVPSLELADFPRALLARRERRADLGFVPTASGHAYDREEGVWLPLSTSGETR